MRVYGGGKLAKRLGIAADQELPEGTPKADRRDMDYRPAKPDLREVRRLQLVGNPRDRAHGTMSGYGAGCRCERCLAAKAREDERAADARRRIEPEDPGDPRHGTYAGYCGGCRCERCRQAGKEYRAAMNARRLVRMHADPSDPRHGTVTGYVAGCRCDRCREARAAHGRAHR